MVSDGVRISGKGRHAFDRGDGALHRFGVGGRQEHGLRRDEVRVRLGKRCAKGGITDNLAQRRTQGRLIQSDARAIDVELFDIGNRGSR